MITPVGDACSYTPNWYMKGFHRSTSTENFSILQFSSYNNGEKRLHHTHWHYERGKQEHAKNRSIIAHLKPFDIAN